MQKIGRLKRVATLSLVLISLVVAQLPVGGQTRRPGRRQVATPPAPAPTSTPSTNPQNKAGDLATGERIKLVQSPKSLAMAQAFESNKLPEPARLPSGSVDQQATALAKAVSAGDDLSTASLYAAVLAAGYGVRDADGSVLQTTEHGQGLMVDAGEVAAMAKLYGEGYGVGLGHLGLAFTRVPTFKDVPLANVLLEGVRAAAKSDQPAVRFWGRFIVELGRNSAAPYDLLGQVNPAEVRLDAVQVFLILSRLAGDLALLERPPQARQRHTSGGTGAAKETVAYSHHAHFRNQVGSGGSGNSRFVYAGLTTPLQHPCGTSDVQGIILDYGALVSTSLHGELLKKLGHTGNNIPIANIVLAVLKFILTYAMLETEIVLAGDPPLIRTKDTKSGEMRMLIARVWIDNKVQPLNCLRPFLNLIGLDFDLPNSGPLADVNVVWEGVLGFDEESRGWITSAQDFIRNLGKEPDRGKPIVYFDVLSNTERSRTQRTGPAGLSIIFVVGSPQEKDLSREKLTKVAKVAGVMFRVQIKSTKNTDAASMLSTIGDFAGPVISLLTGDVAGGAVGLATETLYRMSWRGSDTFYFVVRDWEPCKGLWSGTISVSAKFDETKERTTPGYISNTEEIKKEYQVKYNLADIKDTSENFRNGYFADAFATIEDSRAEVEKLNHGGFCDTGRRDARGAKITEMVKGVLTVTNRLERVGAGTVRTTVYIASRGAEGYNILIDAPPPPVKGVRRSISQYEFPQCPLEEQVNSHRDERPETFYLPQIEFVASFDPNHPGVLAGSKTVRDAAGRPITYTWDLQQCK